MEKTLELINDFAEKFKLDFFWCEQELLNY